MPHPFVENRTYCSGRGCAILVQDKDLKRSGHKGLVCKHPVSVLLVNRFFYKLAVLVLQNFSVCVLYVFHNGFWIISYKDLKRGSRRDLWNLKLSLGWSYVIDSVVCISVPDRLIDPSSVEPWPERLIRPVSCPYANATLRLRFRMEQICVVSYRNNQV